MQQTWCSDPEEVEKELRRLIADKVQLSLYQPGQPPQQLLPAEIFSKEGQALLILRKDPPFAAPKEAGLLLYKQADQPTRGFRAIPVLETQNELGVTLPHSIFWLQRRKFQRFSTAKTNSSVTFTRHGSQYLNHGLVEDISQQGARLTGKFSQHIACGDVLCPMSLTMRLRIGSFEEKITVAEAIVRRVTDLKEGNRVFGVHFLLHGEEQDKLERYLSLCALQSGSANNSG
ncbi:MAG: PilZ domain-containing protein [Thermodesulfobacteriota bacterium]